MSDNGFTTLEVFIALASSNTEQLVDFYTAILQVKPRIRTPKYAEFLAGSLKIAIFQPSADNESEFAAANSGAVSLCLEVNDIERAIARLSTLGYALSDEIMHTSHGQEIYAYDPDGNRVILHQQL